MSHVHALARFLSRALLCEDEEERRRCGGVVRELCGTSGSELVLDIMARHLAGEDTGTGAVTFAGEHARAFATFFNNSRSTVNGREELCLWTELFLQESGHPLDRPVRLVDIGCGDGQAVSRVVRHLSAAGYAEFRVALLDASSEMMDKAVATLQSDVGYRVETFPWRGTVQDMDLVEVVGASFEGESPHVMIGCASVHHMPRDTKLETLRAMRHTKPGRLVLADANSDHDIHLASRSPELIANVCRVYDGLYTGLVEDGADGTVLAAARYFLGSEARDIILKPALDRFDYHTTPDRWIRLLDEAGWEVLCPEAVFRRTSPVPGPASRRRNAFHIDTYVFRDEPLLFSLGARPA